MTREPDLALDPWGTTAVEPVRVPSPRRPSPEEPPAEAAKAVPAGFLRQIILERAAGTGGRELVQRHALGVLDPAIPAAIRGELSKLWMSAINATRPEGEPRQFTMG